MKILKIRMLYCMLLLLGCSTLETKKSIEDYSANFQNRVDNLKVGQLIIKFITKDQMEFENVEVKFSNELPETKYETYWVAGPPIPLPIGKKTAKPTIHSPIFSKNFSRIENNKEINITIEEGNYYFAIESERKEYQFFVEEAKEFLFQFGFTNIEKKNTLDRKVTAYNQNCTCEIQDFLYIHLASCPKVNIVSGEKTFVNIYVSDPKSVNLFHRILMVFPGIIFIPLNQRPLQTYTYREMSVELINPMVDTKKQIESHK